MHKLLALISDFCEAPASRLPLITVTSEAISHSLIRVLEHKTAVVQSIYRGNAALF